MVGQGSPHRPTLPAVNARIPVLIGIGLVAGFFSGLFGVGGGILIVPMLIALRAVSAQVGHGHVAGRGSCSRPLPRPASHASAGNVAWKEGALIGLPAVGGAVVGAYGCTSAIDTRRVVLLVLRVPGAGVGEAGGMTQESCGRSVRLPGRYAVERCSASAAGLIFVPTLIFLGERTPTSPSQRRWRRWCR